MGARDVLLAKIDEFRGRIESGDVDQFNVSERPTAGVVVCEAVIGNQSISVAMPRVVPEAKKPSVDENVAPDAAE